MEAEIGYMASELHQGKGFGAEICSKLISFCQKYMEDCIISAMVDCRNIGSIRVLEKSGMIRIRTLQENGNKIYKYHFKGV